MSSSNASNRMFRLVLVILILVCPSWAAAETNLKIHRLDASKFPVLKVYATIDKDGVPVEAVTSEEVRAKLDGGGEATIKSVASLRKSKEKITLVLAVDTSGSMKQGHLRAIKQAIENLVAQKAPEDQAALISFNDDVYKDMDFTSDSNLFIEKLKALKTGGRITVLFKGVYQGLEMLEKASPSFLSYLVVMSDGHDEGVGFSLDDSINKAKRLNVPVFAIGFSGRADPKYLDNMVRLAKMTAGEYRKAETAEEIIAAYHGLAGMIWDQQVLELEVGVPADGRERSLEIEYQGATGEARSKPVIFRASLPEKPPAKTAALAPGQTPKQDAPRGADKTIFGLPRLAFYGAVGALLLIMALAAAVIIIKRTRKARGIMAENIEGPGDFSSLPVEAEGPGQTPLFSGPRTYLDIPSRKISFPLAPGANTIGAYPNNNLALDEDTVSGYHAEITGNGWEWVLKDLGSTNGTKLNGELIKVPTPLKGNDVIRIGPVEIEVRVTGG
ncbi:MAG: VWA domain-containing protein [Pseudomonadota bacterium]